MNTNQTPPKYVPSTNITKLEEQWGTIHKPVWMKNKKCAITAAVIQSLNSLMLPYHIIYNNNNNNDNNNNNNNNNKNNGNGNDNNNNKGCLPKNASKAFKQWDRNIVFDRQDIVPKSRKVQLPND